MASYHFACIGQEADLLDFANFVFSYSHRPHDFRKLLPKVYDQPAFAPLHAVAEENGRVRAMAALLPGTLRMMAGVSLKTGYVGTVSVHPYSRGEGHMKKLMLMLEDRAREEKMDVMLLGGRRQRYNYFGYERGGTALRFRISRDNVRHALKEAHAQDITFLPSEEASDTQFDVYLDRYKTLYMVSERSRAAFPVILKSWEHKPLLVLENNLVQGYLTETPDGDIAEWAFFAECLPPVLKAWDGRKGGAGFFIRVSQHQVDIITLLGGIAEGFEVSDSAMIRPINWKKVLLAALRFKSSWYPMRDAKAVIDVAGEGRWLMKVLDGVSDVQETSDAADISLGGSQAVQLLFSPLSALQTQAACFANWLPLALDLPAADGF